MSNLKRKALLAWLMVVGVTVLAGCGGGGGNDGGSNGNAADAGPATASVGDTPAGFVAYLKALTATGDDTGEPLKLPTLESIGDDSAEPAPLAG